LLPEPILLRTIISVLLRSEAVLRRPGCAKLTITFPEAILTETAAEAILTQTAAEAAAPKVLPPDAAAGSSILLRRCNRNGQHEKQER
jgi:hypothetical protein